MWTWLCCHLHLGTHRHRETILRERDDGAEWEIWKRCLGCGREWRQW